MHAGRKDLWRTRGIGAFRIYPQPRQQQESFTWIRRLLETEEESKITWFIDASQFDAQYEDTRAFGFAVLAVTPHGRVAAAGFGNPPMHVSTIAQAEAHALAVVLENTLAHHEVITDCQSNVRMLQSGLKAATDPRRRSARTWRRIMQAVDGDASRIALRWIPAHASWQKVRQTQRDGSARISPLEWQCNRAVDELAKYAASSRRTSNAFRRSIERARQTALHYRARLGAVTWAAQNYEVCSINEDGTVSRTVRRDSIGKQAGNAPPQHRKERKADVAVPDLPKAAPPPANASVGSDAPRLSAASAVDQLFKAVRRKFARRHAVHVPEPATPSVLPVQAV